MTTSRAQFSDALQSLKSASTYSYKALANELNVPVSTLHGWCTGKHLPYAREQAKFERMLRLLGVDDSAAWMTTVIRLRQRADSANPYPGLKSFSADDADRFHGRGALTDQLLATVSQGIANDLRPPVVVIGPSGSGKTSLLRAGLVAQLRRQAGCSVCYATPENGIDVLTADIARWLDARTAGPSVLILDQFEMLFASSVLERFDAIIDMVQSVAGQRDVDVVIGLRADFFQRAMATDWIRDGLSTRQLIVRPLTAAEAADCIVRPAESAGMTVDTDLIAELTAEFTRRSTTGKATEALPLLSHVMYLLAEEGQRVLTLDRYRSLGGLSDAVGRAAEAMYQLLDDEEREVGRRLITRLVEVGTDGTLLRRQIDLDWIDTEPLRHVVDLFADARLLMLGRDHVSISHDALLTGWPRLADWIEDSYTTMVVERRVAALAAAWVGVGHTDDALLRGALLAEAADLLGEADRHHFTALDISFIHASTQHHARELEHDAAVISRQLALQSSLLQRTDPALSSHIAVIAVETSPTLEARSALVSATSPLPGGRSLGRAGEVLLGISADERVVVASNGSGGGLRLFTLKDGSLTLEREIPNASDTAVTAVALDATGAALAIGTADGTATIIDLTATPLPAHRTVTTSDDFDGPVHALTFDCDSRRLVIGGQGPHVMIVDTESGADLARWNVAATIFDVAVSASGKSVAAADNDGVITLWINESGNLTDVAETWKDPNPPRATASCVAFSPIGDYLVAGYHDGRLRAFSRESGRPPEAIALSSAPFSSWVNSVAVSSDGELVSAASSDGTVRFWTAKNWQEVRPELEHGSVVTEVRLCGETVITATESGTVRNWPLPSAAVAETDTTIWTTALNGTCSRLLTASGGRCAVWDIASGRLRANPRRFETGSNDLVFSGAGAIDEDGQHVALGTRTGAVFVGGTHSDGPLQALDGPALSLIENLAFSPDGGLLAAVEAAGRLIIWDMTIPPGRLIATLDVPGRPLDLAIDATGELLAVVSDSRDLVLVNLADLSHIAIDAKICVAESFAMSVTFHPTQPIVAVGSADRTLSLWECSDTRRPTLLSRVAGPGGHLVSLSFDGTGTRLAAAITDSTVWIWDTSDLSAPTPDLRITARGSGAYAVALSPDGRTCFGGGPNQQVDTWLLDPEAARAALAASSGDAITRNEWLRLVPESIPGLPE